MFLKSPLYFAGLRGLNEPCLYFLANAGSLYKYAENTVFYLSRNFALERT